MTIKEYIIQKYEEIGDWEFSGKVARQIAYELGKKESNLERRMRELENEGYLEKDYQQINGKGRKVVKYRIKQRQLTLV